jgi:potassium/hydrogen antiporter
MTVPVLFALIGAVILVGFLANLLFRLTKIPSVLLLVAIGVILGPVTGWIRHDSLLIIAPYFGAVALLVILFEGGLELDIAHVVRHAPRTTILAVVVFGLSFAVVAAVAHFLLRLPLINALMLGAILGATSPAICMPVVSGLSVRNDVKTVIKLESAMGEVLLIVSVVLLIQGHATGATGPAGWVWGFARSWLVALTVSSVAGVLWSRLVGWLGREPLSYMLTLGMVCLLYFAVEELGGSPAIAVLLFGIILANMQSIAGRFGPRFRDLFGIDIREEQFVLGQFVVNITAELSFLVRTFFFVYLGLLLDFSALSWSMAAWTAGMFALLLASRRVGVAFFARGSTFSPAELQTIMALQPRGLATAVVAFIPMQAGIPGTSTFPLYAFVVIVLSNLYMTGGVLLAERRLRLSSSGDAPVPAPSGPLTESEWAPSSDDVVRAATEPASRVPDVGPDRRPPRFSPADEFSDEPAPTNLTDWFARLFGLRRADREVEYIEMIRASYLSEPLFWVQAALGAAICALGLILNETAIVIGGALIVPLVRPVIATGLALAAGDLYLLAKLVTKLVLFSVMVVAISAALIDLLPFGVTTAEIADRASPTILDFLVALFGGMSGAALISVRRRAFHYLPGAVIAITLLPALCVMGFGLGASLSGPIFRGGALQFTANLFAAVLGAAAVLTMAGVQQAAQCPSVRQWKEEELQAPFAQAFFGRLHLRGVIGRSGTLRARLVVVGVFLLSLLIPLQLAFNQLKQEFRTRQAISRAQTIFDVPSRSTVLSSAFTLAGDGVDVRLQVATNELFGDDDIKRFEERVFDQAGRRVRLELVQTLGDIGKADTIRRLLTARAPAAPPIPARSVFGSLQDLGSTVRRILNDMPLPERVAVIGVRGEFAAAAGPAVEVVYLADTELGPDARSMLVKLLAARTFISPDRIAVRRVPAAWTIGLSWRGSLVRGAEATLRELRATLVEYPGLEVGLELPPRMSAGARDSARANLEHEIGRTELTVTTPAGAVAPEGVLRLGARKAPAS